VGRSEESSFLKKRNKRLLFFRRSHDRGHGRDIAAGAGIKVFWFFSSEKNMLFWRFVAWFSMNSRAISGFCHDWFAEFASQGGLRLCSERKNLHF
jgi:hypothetical protein